MPAAVVLNGNQDVFIFLLHFEVNFPWRVNLMAWKQVGNNVTRFFLWSQDVVRVAGFGLNIDSVAFKFSQRLVGLDHFPTTREDDVDILSRTGWRCLKFEIWSSSLTKELSAKNFFSMSSRYSACLGFQIYSYLIHLSWPQARLEWPPKGFWARGWARQCVLMKIRLSRTKWAYKNGPNDKTARRLIFQKQASVEEKTRNRYRIMKVEKKRGDDRINSSVDGNDKTRTP